MLLGDTATLYLFERLQEEHGWSNVPSEATLHDIRRGAEDLSGRNTAEPVAAIFFAFCVNESRLRDGANLFPFLLACA